MQRILITLSKLINTQIAFAHCDIPCGIYDPFNAQRAAHTILRMSNLLKQIKQDDDLTSDHAIVRMTHVKEEHSNILEEELETLRNDYFKEEHFKQFENLNSLFLDALKLSSKARQNIDLESAQELLEKVLQISEIFFKSKGVEPIRIKSIYPTESDIVLYK